MGNCVRWKTMKRNTSIPWNVLNQDQGIHEYDLFRSKLINDFNDFTVVTSFTKFEIHIGFKPNTDTITLFYFEIVNCEQKVKCNSLFMLPLSCANIHKYQQIKTRNSESWSMESFFLSFSIDSKLFFTWHISNTCP